MCIRDRSCVASPPAALCRTPSSPSGPDARPRCGPRPRPARATWWHRSCRATGWCVRTARSAATRTGWTSSGRCWSTNGRTPAEEALRALAEEPSELADDRGDHGRGGCRAEAQDDPAGACRLRLVGCADLAGHLALHLGDRDLGLFHHVLGLGARVEPIRQLVDGGLQLGTRPGDVRLDLSLRLVAHDCPSLEPRPCLRASRSALMLACARPGTGDVPLSSDFLPSMTSRAARPSSSTATMSAASQAGMASAKPRITVVMSTAVPKNASVPAAAKSPMPIPAFFAFSAISVLAVSYTHLTLP